MAPPSLMVCERISLIAFILKSMPQPEVLTVLSTFCWNPAHKAFKFANKTFTHYKVVCTNTLTPNWLPGQNPKRNCSKGFIIVLQESGPIAKTKINHKDHHSKRTSAFLPTNTLQFTTILQWFITNVYNNNELKRKFDLPKILKSLKLALLSI